MDYIYNIYLKNNMIAEFISILSGFIVGYISYVIIQKYRTKTHGPDSNIIKKKIYKYNNKYYKLIPQICICPLF